MERASPAVVHAPTGKPQRSNYLHILIKDRQHCLYCGYDIGHAVDPFFFCLVI